MEDIIGKNFLQNCGDILKVVQKTNKKSKDGSFLFECEFIKYPYKILVKKSQILSKSVLNPQIEQIEFIDKIWPQKCGDSIKILNKSLKKGGFWDIEFIKYPYIIKNKTKQEIINGTIINPLIEKFKFIGKEFKQNCGDILIILEKTNIKNGSHYYYKCKFQKYPCEVLAEKGNILKGTVNNPQIEETEFINKIWPQNCGDSLKIIGTKINKDKRKVYECEFLNYPYKTIEEKSHIKKGVVLNHNFPLYKKENLIDFIKNNFDFKPSIKELSNVLKRETSTIGSYILLYNLQDYIDYCPIISNCEKEIKAFISQYIFCENTWKELDGKEIDIYIPNLKLGIEYNGSYWHSELFKNSNYHQEKSLLAQKKGIQLFHIWEWEWALKQQICKSYLKSKLGIFEKKIGASRCITKEISIQEYENFCNENHFQGSAGAKVRLGLFYKDELIQIMSFSKPRFSDKYEWEIIRECSKLGCIIIGGKEKLWKYFIEKYNPKNCISYCDFSKFNGNSYLKLGFRKERLNKPGFWWVNKTFTQIFWRNPYKNQEMKEKGYLKIYDCGQLVFTWEDFNNL